MISSQTSFVHSTVDAAYYDQFDTVRNFSVEYDQHFLHLPYYKTVHFSPPHTYNFAFSTCVFSVRMLRVHCSVCAGCRVLMTKQSHHVVAMEEFDISLDKFVIFCEKILFSGTLPSFLHLKLTNVRA